MQYTLLRAKIIFRCDSISRPDLWKVLVITNLKLINFEDFKQTTNRRPTEDDKKKMTN